VPADTLLGAGVHGLGGDDAAIGIPGVCNSKIEFKREHEWKAGFAFLVNRPTIRQQA